MAVIQRKSQGNFAIPRLSTRFAMSFRSASISAVLLLFVPCWVEPLRSEESSADVLEAEKDPDFLVQGEYVNEQRGMQVVAAGDGEFDIVIFEGGLPGAGAKAIEPRRIDGDADVVADLVDSMQLRRVVRSSPTLLAKPPAGAVVLFDGTQKSVDEHWHDGRLTESGLLMEGTSTRALFGDYNLHLEFRTPWLPQKSGQARGNSGVYHQGRYEIQILDSFGLVGRNNETGGIYSVRAPDLNMCFPPLRWQTYDVEFTAARFDDTGAKTANARMTVRLNGVVVQDETVVPKSTTASKLKEGPSPGPVYLQDHGNPVRYRNIWIVPRDSDREARRPIVPGFERFFAVASPPSAIGGELLISNLACDACHARTEETLVPLQRGPDLSELAGRARTDAIVAMIARPHAVKPGTTMPDVWHDLGQNERTERARAIASYLTLRGKGETKDRTTNRKTVARGKELYHRVGCVACHDAYDGSDVPAATTVPLGKLGQKYTLGSLAQFLREPHRVRPGLRMPALTGSASDAYAIASYLTRDVTQKESTGRFRRRVYRGSWQKLPDFDLLDPVSSEEVIGLKYDDIKPQNDFGVVFEADLPIEESGRYTFRLSSDDGSALQVGENRIDNDGVHPMTTREATFDLKEGIHPIRIELFNAGGGVELELTLVDPRFGQLDVAGLIRDRENLGPTDLLPSEFQPQASLVQQGRRWFRENGCANCHAFGSESAPAISGPPLDQMRDRQGCLAAEVRSPAVDYELNQSQRSAIAAAILSRRTKRRVVKDELRVQMTMAALNCYACHRRGEFGGPEPKRDSQFKTKIPEMGLEGRLPPPLDGVGDKLNDQYFAKLFDHGGNLRPYMQTRMPGYRFEALQHLHRAIVTIDRRFDATQANHKQSTDAILSAGRQAVGNGGLACIKCHSFGGEKGGGIGAIDMLKMNDRLRVSWFHRYLQNPTRFRPGTRMPNSFVDGRSALTELYDGDPTLQIDAMWRYLAQGESAKEPEGLKQGAIELTAHDRPRIYRNFFEGVSGRGIGVGYPQKINLIWDAERMTLARVWKNSFIDASMHWRNRGQGRQQPLGDSVIEIDSSTPFALLEKVDSAWPTSFGREQGYRFLGYRLDKAGNPTFRYAIGNIMIEDTPRPSRQGDATNFTRQFQIDLPETNPNPVLVWLAASGNIQKLDDRYAINGNYEMAIEGADCQLIDNGDQRQLRVVITGTSSRIIQSIDW